ncbi:unnamed protein product [Paramecium pentaurelia]|uniref:Uncharacterized protein n=1 Tax=Paramecium pentaurelia TaxID=43138 RepID=A0A8S1TUF1_9CILI|nr:unnamed protein product [Paramecium pentaurelia]
MLNQKREIFRINIRQQKHQEIFQQKRILSQQKEQEYSFQQLIDAMDKAKIITLRNLVELNGYLQYFTQKKLTIEQILLIESNANNLMPILTNHIVYNVNDLTKEILKLLVNLTQFSEKISINLLKYSCSDCNIIQILSSFILNRIEVIETLNLLMNLWSNSNSHQIYDQNLIQTIDAFLDICISIKDNMKILLISKCLKNYLQNISDENIFEYEYLINIVRKLLNYGIQETSDFIDVQIEAYCSIVQVFNHNFVIQDLNMILNLLDYCMKRTELIEIVTRIFSYFSINEPDSFYEKLIISVIYFSKHIIKSSLNEQIPCILNLCSIIFHQQCEKNYNILWPFYNDTVIIMEIIRLQEDCQPRKIREASIRCIKILIENSNENQIQLLIFSKIHLKLIDLLNDFSLNSSSILFTLISLNNLIKIQRNKCPEFLELQNLILLTKSKNKDIQKLTYEIIQQVEEINYNLMSNILL